MPFCAKYTKSSMPQEMNTSTMGISMRPERITARAPFLLSGAASMRCTMSWSVPWVAMVMKVEPNTALHRVYSLLRIFLISCTSPCPVSPESKNAQGFRFLISQGL